MLRYARKLTLSLFLFVFSTIRKKIVSKARAGTGAGVCCLFFFPLFFFCTSGKDWLLTMFGIRKRDLFTQYNNDITIEREEGKSLRSRKIFVVFFVVFSLIYFTFTFKTNSCITCPVVISMKNASACRDSDRMIILLRLRQYVSCRYCFTPKD